MKLEDLKKAENLHRQINETNGVLEQGESALRVKIDTYRSNYGEINLLLLKDEAGAKAELRKAVIEAVSNYRKSLFEELRGLGIEIDSEAKENTDFDEEI